MLFPGTTWTGDCIQASSRLASCSSGPPGRQTGSSWTRSSFPNAIRSHDWWKCLSNRFPEHLPGRLLDEALLTPPEASAPQQAGHTHLLRGPGGFLQSLVLCGDASRGKKSNLLVGFAAASRLAVREARQSRSSAWEAEAHEPEARWASSRSGEVRGCYGGL